MINIVLIIIGTLLLSLAGVVKKDQSKSIYFRKNFLFIIVGIILIGYGTILNAVKQSKVENDLLESLRANSQLDEEIASISKKSFATITGGDSYIVVMPTFLSKEREHVSLVVTSYGDYPLYDVKIEIIDIDKENQIENQFTLEEKKENPGLVVGQLMKAHYNFTVGNKIQGQGQIIPASYELNYNGLNKRRFAINVFARNGIFRQYLRMKKIGSDWVSAYRVRTSNGDNNEIKVLFSRIDEKYKEIENDW